MPRPIFPLLACIVALFFGCKSDKPPVSEPLVSEPPKWIPPHERPPRLETAPETLETRFPGAGAVFAKHGIHFQSLRVLPTEIAPVLRIDLGLDSKFRQWNKFQSVISDLGEASGWKNDLVLVDSAHRIEVEVSLYSLGEGRGGIELTDSAGYFLPPTASSFENGLDRVSLSPEQAGVVYDAQPSGDYFRGADCNEISEINGRIYYNVQLWERPVDPEGGEGMTHTLDWLLVDAGDGTQWKMDIAHSGMYFRGKKAKTRFLREVVDSTSEGWKLLGGSCSQAESAHIWQYRPRDRRLQHIRLAPVDLVDELSLDTLGVGGHIVQLHDGQDLSQTYFLIRDQDASTVVRSGRDILFSQIWNAPEPLSEVGASDFSVKEYPSGAVTIKLSGKSYSIGPTDWQPVPTISHRNIASTSCDTCPESAATTRTAKPPGSE